jgi:hypothetical protein
MTPAPGAACEKDAGWRKGLRGRLSRPVDSWHACNASDSVVLQKERNLDRWMINKRTDSG